MHTKSQRRNEPCGLAVLAAGLVNLLLLLHCLSPLGAGAQTYSVLHHFDGGAGGKGPWSGLACSGTTLYGTTELGGQYGYGTVFKINLDGTGFTILRHLAFADGVAPMGDLLLAGSTLYGTTSRDGTSAGGGSLFRMNTDGSGFAVLKYFTGPDGRGPRGGVTISGDVLYGTTKDGGTAQPHAKGTIFRINTDGTGFAILHHYGTADGNNPWGTLVVSGTTLYGVTDDYSSGQGTVFKLNTDGTGYTILKRFSGPDGRMPIGGLLLSGSTLYGTTVHGGDYTWGTVFKLNTDGTGFVSLHSFPAIWMPYGGVVLSGGTLFGTTSGGGAANRGTLFRINTDGTDFAVIKDFLGTEGVDPVSRLLLYGDALYGTTRAGGMSAAGVVFKQPILPPAILEGPASCTAEAGTEASFEVVAESCVPASYQWFFNATQPIGSSTATARLDLTNLQFSNSGAYALVVTNYFGAVTSAAAQLSVIPMVPRSPAPCLTLEGELGSLLQVDCLDAIAPNNNWTPLTSLTLTSSPALCGDPTLPLPAMRFYRAWQAGPADAARFLGLAFVPAITLTGNPGDQRRVDFINAVGPIDAWSPLGTVTLSNSAQLFFDTSAQGQPRRLYRIVPLP